MKRRSFLKKSLASGALALGGVAAYQWYLESGVDYSQTKKLRFLTQDDQVLLGVIIPVVAQSIPAQPKIFNVIENIDEAIVRLPLATQDELRQLFDSLGSGLGRLLMAGVWLNWQAADQQSIDAFLWSWRDHSMGLLQDAYVGLHKMVIGAIYAEPVTWKAAGYDGPPF